jgi:hypothetical protein
MSVTGRSGRWRLTADDAVEVAGFGDHIETG